MINTSPQLAIPDFDAYIPRDGIVVLGTDREWQQPGRQTCPNGPRYTEGSLEAPTALMLLLELTRPKEVRPFTGDGATAAAADMDSFGGIAIPLIACILYQQWPNIIYGLQV